MGALQNENSQSSSILMLIVRVGMGAGSGLIVGLVTAVIAISLAAIAYSGDLESYAGAAAVTALLGTAAASVIGAWTLTYRGTVMGTQDITAVTLSIAATGLLASSDGIAPDRVFATVATMMTIATALTGGLFILLGSLKAGAVARYVPYPVIGGFLAATGLLLVLAVFAMSTGRNASVFDLPDIITNSATIRWAPAVCLAIALFVLGQLFKHPAVLTGFLGVSLLAFYAALFVTGTSVEEARELGLLLGTPTSNEAIRLADLTVPSLAAGADFGAILSQAPTLLTVAVLAAVGMVMSASGLEHTTQRELDVNREFVGTGLANFGSAVMGGLPVYHYFGSTTLAYTLHLRAAAAGLSAAAVCVTLVLAGSAVITNLPICVLAGLSGFIGLNLLYEWLVVKRHSLPGLDYAVVVLILVVMVGVGFMEGVATGLVACVVSFAVSSGRQDVVVKSYSSATRPSMVDRGSDARNALAALGHRNQIVELRGHLFFGTANKLYQDVTALLAQHDVSCVIIDFRRVQSVDSSAVHSLEKLVTRCGKNNTHVVLTGVPARLREASGLKGALESGAAVAFDEQDEGMEWAEDRLLAAMSFEEQATPNEALLDLFRTSASPYAIKRELSAGDPLVSVGEPSDGYFLVEAGQLSVTIPTADGKGFRIRSVGPGALIGEVGHYTGEPRTATVVATTTCTVLHAAKGALEAMEREDPRAASQLHRLAAKYLATRLTENTILVEHSR